MTFGSLTCLLLMAALGMAVQAQPKALPKAEEIEPSVNGFLASIRTGDLDKILPLLGSESRRYSPGGVALGLLAGRDAFRVRFWNGQKSRSFYLRHIHVISADSALVVGLWRNPTAQPPQDAGMFDWTFRRESGGEWKIVTWRDGFVPSPHLAGLANGPAIGETGQDGFQPLFDGKTSNGWLTPAGDAKLPTGWKVADGALVTVAGPGAERIGIRTRQEFTNFDLRFEWQVAANANSGVLYRLYTLDFIGGGPIPSAAGGLEYQVADDDGDPGAKIDARQKSGALYAVVPVVRSVAKPVGEWNEGRIVVTGERIEHWLNGVQTASYPVDVPFASPILLQHHSSEVRFRNLRIRPLP